MMRLDTCLPMLAAAALLGACGSVPMQQAPDRDSGASPPATAAGRPGGYYKDDGPGDHPPDLDAIADAQPKVEPLHRFANNPYTVFGVSYTPLKSHAPFHQRGIASWYGRMFQGQLTSSGEPYDMYGMTAAHPTLPIPSYARVTRVGSPRRSVIVRINDRGPFHPGRIIDLSYAAAYKLGFVRQGSALVDVDLLTPEDIASLDAARSNEAARVQPVAAPEPPGSTALPAQVPPASAPSPVAAVSLPGTQAAAPSAQGAVYVQVGAFSVRANAESLRSRIVRELADVNDAAVAILQRGGSFRVHVGPYRSRGEASGVAARLHGLLQLNPLFVSQ
jgi:rare lipoprotein A